MKNKLTQIALVIFLVLANYSSIFYLYGLFFDVGKYIDLSQRAPIFEMISPLPLVFDRREYFNSPTINLTLVGGQRNSVEISKKYLASISGPPHRKLHILRLFAFADFYQISPLWETAIRHMVCHPENMEIDVPSIEDVTRFNIENKYIHADGTYIKYQTKNFFCR